MRVKFIVIAAVLFAVIADVNSNPVSKIVRILSRNKAEMRIHPKQTHRVLTPINIGYKRAFSKMENAWIKDSLILAAKSPTIMVRNKVYKMRDYFYVNRNFKSYCYLRLDTSKLENPLKIVCAPPVPV